eukprot:scaffold5594_cov69-Phaeocystis_antarctica.AAC.1
MCNGARRLCGYRESTHYGRNGWSSFRESGGRACIEWCSPSFMMIASSQRTTREDSSRSTTGSTPSAQPLSRVPAGTWHTVTLLEGAVARLASSSSAAVETWWHSGVHAGTMKFSSLMAAAQRGRCVRKLADRRGAAWRDCDAACVAS